jgi:hypothetical protein
MAIKNVIQEDEVDFEQLGIGQVQEPDRMQLDERGAMSITRIRFDYKTKYWNDKTQSGTPIIKFDGVDIATGERVKYFTLSSVIYKTMADILEKVGSVVQMDENGNEWHILKQAVKIKGFEKVKTGVKGQNPYLKIKTN